MSLRGFHIAFIILATLLAFLIGVWGVVDGNNPPLGLLSIVAGVLLSGYGIWFVRKLLDGKAI